MNYEVSLVKSSNYKQFLRLLKNERGLLAKLASASHCQPSYLSAVINESAHLTIDQVFGIAKHLNLSDDARDLLFALVDLEKSATPAARAFFKKRVASCRLNCSRLEKTNGIADFSMEKLATEYYFDHFISALHILLQINPLPRELQKHLGISSDRLKNYLDILKKLNIIEVNGHKVSVVKYEVHAPADSNVSKLHLSNWRDIARRRIADGNLSGTHLTSLYAVSHEDLAKFRYDLKGLWLNFQKTVARSAPEVAACFNLDLFLLSPQE